MGEFANDGVIGTETSGSTNEISTNSLVLKLLKSSIINVNQPVWDLMMKNIYSLGSTLDREDFKLNIFYSDPSPLNYLNAEDRSIWPENIDGKTLLSLFNMDNLNINNNIQDGGDGFFDFVPNVTVDSNNGLIIFTLSLIHI